ncbi:MAG: chemotaxis protein CheW [Acidobacteriota bacterium]
MQDHQQPEIRQSAPRIDWNAVYRRLESVRKSIEQIATPTPQQRNWVLRERAKALAREAHWSAGSVEPIQVLEFLLAYERYAVELAFIREVFPLKELTPVPATPAFVMGIINVRGEIISVIDLKKFFDLPSKGLTDLNKVIILRQGDLELGILADSVFGVSEIPVEHMQPGLPTLTGIRQQYLKGITNTGLVILDVAKIAADPRIVVRDESEAV